MALPVGVLLAAVLSLCLAPPPGAGFDDGRAAYQRGDYAMALGHWLPLATAGAARARFSVGLLYDKGYGVSQDHSETAR